jgi:hypothetical protein
MDKELVCYSKFVCDLFFVIFGLCCDLPLSGKLFVFKQRKYLSIQINCKEGILKINLIQYSFG